MVDLTKLTPAGLKALKALETSERQHARTLRLKKDREGLSEEAYNEPLHGWDFTGADDPPEAYRDHYAKYGARVMLAQMRKDTEIYLDVKDGHYCVSASDSEGGLLVTEAALCDVVQFEIDLLEDAETLANLKILRGEFSQLAQRMTDAIDKFESES